ncbi:MFS transporter [Pseudonocardia sp. NPDC046786]|uniref:MFS transporter n=1 Tax=Pseudonocardia sp. NPDC046786 TaxID=3155471 RepID=UPI0033CF8AF0
MSSVRVPARPTWREWTGLILLALPLFMMATDFTAIFLAMPAVAADVAPTTTQMLWIVHIGELVAAGMVITMGWLTGRIGPRTLLLVAMALYGAGSALAAFAPDAETLLLARILIGVATAAASPAGIAMLRSMFTSAKHFGVAFAVVMGAFSVGGALGPPLAGVLLEHFWWGSVFLVNVPVAAAVLVTGLWLYPRASERTTDRIDMTSVVVSMTAVILLVLGLQEIADHGFSVPYALATLLGIGLGAWFLRRQRRIDNPLLDVDLFSIRVVRVLALVYVLAQLAFLTVDFVLIQYLQIVSGVSTAQLGLLLAVAATAAILGTALTPALTRRFTPATVMAAGVGLAVVGTALVLTAIAVAPMTAFIAVGMTTVSFGISPPMVLGAQLMVTSVPQKQAGPVASVQDIAASLGATGGIVFLGSIAMAVFGRLVNAGSPDSVSDADRSAATQSPGGAVAVAEQIGGQAGQELLRTAQDALSQGTLAAHIAALVIGVITTVLVVRGLRGVELPTDEAAPSTADSEPSSEEATGAVAPNQRPHRTGRKSTTTCTEDAPREPGPTGLSRGAGAGPASGRA